MKTTNYPMPCDHCDKNNHRLCNYRDCAPWKIRYLYRQKQINAYAKKVLPDYDERQRKWREEYGRIKTSGTSV